MTMLTRILASSVRTIPWTLGRPFLSFFFYNGGILCACDGLTKIHKSYKKDTIIYIYIYIYIISIFLDFVFFRFHFIDSFLMIKLNCIYQKACLMN